MIVAIPAQAREGEGERMSVLRLVVAVLIVALALVACEVKGPFHIPKTGHLYRSWQAPGEVALSQGAQNLHWLDDDRVLFLGRDGAESSESSVRIWSISTGEVKVVAPSIGNICYFRGYLTYQGPVDERIPVVHHGSINASEPRRVDHMALFHAGYRMHPINCRYYHHKTELAPQENCKVPLLPGDGSLNTRGDRCDEGAQERVRQLAALPVGSKEQRMAEAQLDLELESSAVRFVPPSSPAGVRLPIEANEIPPFGHGFAYVEWKHAYLLPQVHAKGQLGKTTGKWPRDQPYRIYLLRANGTLETIEVPITEKFVYTPQEATVTRAGPLLKAPRTTRDMRTELLGLVLYGPGGPEIVSGGWTRQMALSPSGCRVAYDRQLPTPDRKGLYHITLHAIDVCSGGR
jgi:hypothetical protein